MSSTLHDGLSDLHMLALLCLAGEPFATAHDVTELLGVPVAVAVRLVAELQAAGMIEREPVQ